MTLYTNVQPYLQKGFNVAAYRLIKPFNFVQASKP